ncbi:hypothetical protein GGR56DRAFT_23334 [Xylariaceae sp. FL0804]|nr:hypothetical protein GGR56DRAFT_23334 [Xylariaceae sp. FL0804]
MAPAIVVGRVTLGWLSLSADGALRLVGAWLSITLSLTHLLSHLSIPSLSLLPRRCTTLSEEEEGDTLSGALRGRLLASSAYRPWLTRHVPRSSFMQCDLCTAYHSCLPLSLSRSLWSLPASL